MKHLNRKIIDRTTLKNGNESFIACVSNINIQKQMACEIIENMNEEDFYKLFQTKITEPYDNPCNSNYIQALYRATTFVLLVVYLLMFRSLVEFPLLLVPYYII